MSSTPSSQELQDGAEVLGAGEQAAAAEPEPAKKRAAAARAIKGASAQKGWDLSDEQADKLAAAALGQVKELLEELPQSVADMIRQMGGFDKLPEPVTVPAAPTGQGEAPSEPPAAAAPADEHPASGGAKSFARWFRTG